MHYHSQNLNERGNKVAGSKFWHGWEWSLGKFASDFAITMSFGQGDGLDGVMLHVCLPWLFSIFIGVEGVRRCKKPWKTGIEIHNCAFWIYPAPFEMESNRSDPWYRRNYSFPFPWEWTHFKTEILTHERKVVWVEVRGHMPEFLDGYEVRKAAEAHVSKRYDYTYTRKNSEVQKTIATVRVDRMTHRMRWWPLLPFSKTSTRIWVDFDGEVGEGTGSWKGGTTGCGYTLRDDETPEQCLRRMERERKFDR